MNNPYGISKAEDVEGSNYIIQSRLKNYKNKTISNAYSVKAVTNGVEHYKINGEDQQLVEGNFMVVHPGQEVEVYIDSKSEVEGICYYLDPDLIYDIRNSNKHSVEKNLANITPQNESTSAAFDNIAIHSFRTLLKNHFDTAQFGDLTKQHISEYLISLAEDLICHQDKTNLQLKALEGIRSVTKQELYKRLQQGRQFIHDNYNASITLKEMSRAAGLSEYYFHRNFRTFFNSTPYEYHNAVRMLKAHSLMSNVDHSRREVAFQCGFQDVKYFSKAYKRWQTAS